MNPFERKRESLALPAGIKNVGNTCYINSLLQVLLVVITTRIPFNQKYTYFNRKVADFAHPRLWLKLRVLIASHDVMSLSFRL